MQLRQRARAAARAAGVDLTRSLCPAAGPRLRVLLLLLLLVVASSAGAAWQRSSSAQL